jgi:drug/metabolite transporter (DMT)-like permease
LSPTKAQRFAGILYTLSASFLFTTSVFVTKQLNVDLFSAVIPRFLCHIVMLIIYVKFIKHYSLYKQSTKQEIFLLFINNFFGTTGFLTLFLAYRYLPLPDVTTIRYTQVIWTAIITSILYREKPSIFIILGVLLTTAGVTLVAQPKLLFEKTSNITINKISTDSYNQHWIGLLIAFYSSLASSIVIISFKYLLSTYKTKQSVIVLQNTFIAFLITLVYLFYKYYFINDKIQSLKNEFLNWKYLCASSICLLHIVASIFVQKGIKREHPSIFTFVRSSDILFSILLQNIFSTVKSNLLSLLGSILVITSILIISGYKLISEKKKTVQM